MWPMLTQPGCPYRRHCVMAGARVCVAESDDTCGNDESCGDAVSPIVVSRRRFPLVGANQFRASTGLGDGSLKGTGGGLPGSRNRFAREMVRGGSSWLVG